MNLVILESTVLAFIRDGGGKFNFFSGNIHSANHNFTEFLGMKILWKDTVSAELRDILWKLYGHCAFTQNCHTRKLGEIKLFYAVMNSVKHFSYT